MRKVKGKANSEMIKAVINLELENGECEA